MKRFSIKKETESLVNKSKRHLTEITPHVAKDIFLIIRDKLYDEYMELCRETKKKTVNQWTGKAICAVFNLRHNNEHIRVTEEGHLIKTYTVFYQ